MNFNNKMVKFGTKAQSVLPGGCELQARREVSEGAS